MGPRKQSVATAPTVYGIETLQDRNHFLGRFVLLQQHLPFTVLKPNALEVVV